jgi:hypothetical protein
MPNTYQAIATVTVGAGGASGIEFTSIPATYSDIVVLASLRDNRTTDATNYTRLQLNGNTTATVKLKAFTGGGSAGVFNDNVTYTNGIATLAAVNATNAGTTSTFGNLSIYIPNYTSSEYKSISIDAVNESNISALIGTQLAAILYQTTSAITSIQLTSDPTAGGTYQQYSTATLYGIKNS